MLLSLPTANDRDAEQCFKQSLECSRRQGARAWELRAAIELASLWAGRGESMKAGALLRPVFDRFDEGAESMDLVAAEKLLAALS